MVFYDLFCASIVFELVLYFFVFIVYLLSALLFCILTFSINFSCVLGQFWAIIVFEHVGPINFLFIVYAFIVQNSALISQVFLYPFCAWILFEFVYSYLFTLYLFVGDCYSLWVIIPVIKTLFWPLCFLESLLWRVSKPSRVMPRNRDDDFCHTH